MRKLIFCSIFLLIARMCFASPSNSISTPNSFTAGSTIQSSQVNSDFSEIQNKYNTHTHIDITAVGTITSGIWNGNVIAVQFGGLGLNASTGPQGSIVYFNGTGTIGLLNAGTSGGILTTKGSGSNPTWVNPTTSAGSGVIYLSDTSGHIPAQMGAWGSTLNADQEYTATTDGFLVGDAACSGNNSTASIQSPTGTTRQQVGGGTFAALSANFGFCIPVRKGATYKVVTSGTVTVSRMFFLATGN